MVLKDRAIDIGEDTMTQRRVAIMLDLEWPFKRHAEVFAGVQQYAHEREWYSVIDEYADAALPTQLGQPVPYHGVIARATGRLASRAARLGVPVVNVWFSSPATKVLPGVFPDFRSMGAMRAEHLLTRGFRRFAALIAEEEQGQLVELQGFTSRLEESGCACQVAEVPPELSSSLKAWRKTQKTISNWMKAWQVPIGVYTGFEAHGRIVVQMCDEAGWRVPEDVAIIAGWNEQTFCEHSRPTLTSIEVGYARMGYEAARLLDRLMNQAEESGGPFPAEHLVLPAQSLIVRESTDFYAVENELMRSALEFIAAHCHKKIGPGDVAKAVNTETRTLQRRFQEYLNRPISVEIRRVRIERAKRELAHTDRSVASISRSVGFGPPMRMYEVFRRELGVSPSEFRRQRQQEAAS